MQFATIMNHARKMHTGDKLYIEMALSLCKGSNKSSTVGMTSNYKLYPIVKLKHATETYIMSSPL